jgi:hypothetical protein
VWRPATVAGVACLLLLAGCGGNTDKPDPGSAQAGNDGVIESTVLASMPSGIVFSRDSVSVGTKSLGTKTLSVYDPATGQLLGTAVAPYVATVTDRERFDATMARLVYVSDCKLQVAALSAGTYLPAGQWEPAQAYGEGKQCYADPAFKDGRVWAELRVLNASVNSPYRLVSVDPDHPETPAKDEGAGTPFQEKQYTIAGRSESDVRVYTEDGMISKVWVTGTLPQRKGQYFADSYSYKCDARVDDTTFLCSADHGQDQQPFGSVAVVSVNRSAATVAVKQVAPSSKARNATVFVGPDRKHVAIRDESGWYTAALDATSPPARSPLSDQQSLGDPLFWN